MFSVCQNNYVCTKIVHFDIFFSLHITPIKSNAKTIEKPKKIKDSERVTK